MAVKKSCARRFELRALEWRRFGLGIAKFLSYVEPENVMHKALLSGAYAFQRLLIGAGRYRFAATLFLICFDPAANV